MIHSDTFLIHRIRIVMDEQTEQLAHADSREYHHTAHAFAQLRNQIDGGE